MKSKTKVIKEHEDASLTDTVSVAWIAREYPYHEKSLLWFIIAAVILAGLVIYGLLTDGWTFSMAVIVAAGAYYVSHRTPPELVTISVTDRGIKVGRHLIEYATIKYFWIAYTPPVIKRLYIRLNSKLSANIAIELEDVDVQELRKALQKRCTENKNLNEPFTESLIRLFRL